MKLVSERVVGGTCCACVVFAMAVCSVPQHRSPAALQGGEERGNAEWGLFSLLCVQDVVLPLYSEAAAGLSMVSAGSL